MVEVMTITILNKTYVFDVVNKLHPLLEQQKKYVTVTEAGNTVLEGYIVDMNIRETVERYVNHLIGQLRE